MYQHNLCLKKGMVTTSVCMTGFSSPFSKNLDSSKAFDVD